MWIFLSNTFISVVQKSGDTDLLTVLARIKGDIERVFPDALVQANQGTDYKYRAKVPREAVAKALYDQAMAVDYVNSNSTVKDRNRNDVYMNVWAAMYAAQGR